MITFEPLALDARDFLSEKTNGDFLFRTYEGDRWVCATSRDMGFVDGVLLGEFTSRFEVHMTVALDNPRIITRRLLYAVFTTFFSRAARVTATCRPENKQAISCVERMGFQREGYMRRAIEGTWDAVLFGMLEEECPWLRAPMPKVYPRAPKYINTPVVERASP